MKKKWYLRRFIVWVVKSYVYEIESFDILKYSRHLSKTG